MDQTGEGGNVELHERGPEGWGADPGTDDGDKFDILATLVEKYENEHWPLDTSRVDPTIC